MLVEVAQSDTERIDGFVLSDALAFEDGSEDERGTWPGLGLVW